MADDFNANAALVDKERVRAIVEERVERAAHLLSVQAVDLFIRGLGTQPLASSVLVHQQTE